MTPKPITEGYGDSTWLSTVFIFRIQAPHQEEVQSTWGGRVQTACLLMATKPQPCSPDV